MDCEAKDIICSFSTLFMPSSVQINYSMATTQSKLGVVDEVFQLLLLICSCYFSFLPAQGNILIGASLFDVRTSTVLA